jgi:hypothetical protein
MRRFLASPRPSPAMAVAFIALLAALSGTAIALPGKNSVDSGDIKNGNVKTKDIKNNDVRSGDVRNSTLTGGDVKDNSLTGADINESTLGTVPNANSANSANSATTANSANSANAANHANSADSANTANSAASVSGFQHTGQARITGDGTQTLFSAAGFRVELRCELLAGPGGTTRASIEVVNESAGDNSHFYSSWNNVTDTDWDQGETADTSAVESQFGAEENGGPYPASAFGSSGSVLVVDGMFADQTDEGFGGADCVGAAFGFSN